MASDLYLLYQHPQPRGRLIPGEPWFARVPNKHFDHGVDVPATVKGKGKSRTPLYNVQIGDGDVEVQLAGGELWRLAALSAWQ
jgi:hypothetical protein